jgi:hypothetical protein
VATGCGGGGTVGSVAAGGSTASVAGGIADGIATETAGITGVSATAGGGGTVTAGRAGIEVSGVVAAATIAVGSTGITTPSSPRAGLAASAATAPHTERPRASDELRDMIQEDMYPDVRRDIRKNNPINVPFILAAA